MLNSNHKEYTVPIKELEIEGMPAKEGELCVGSDVIWLHKGKRPYEGHVVEVPPGIASKKRKVQCKFYYSSHFKKINLYIYDIASPAQTKQMIADECDDSFETNNGIYHTIENIYWILSLLTAGQGQDSDDGSELGSPLQISTPQHNRKRKPASSEGILLG